MKVKELIEKFSQLDPELMVVIRGYEGGVNEVTDYGLCNIWLNANDEWYYGKHEDANMVDKTKYTIVEGVIL